MKWFDIKNKNYWRVSNHREYSIQEVAHLSGITVRTLRNYLKTYESLLSPKRGYYNSLVFSNLDVQIFLMIKTLIKDGFRQEEVIEKVQAQIPSLMEEEDRKRHEENSKKETPSFNSLPAETLPQEPDSDVLEISESFFSSANKERSEINLQTELKHHTKTHPLLTRMNEAFLQMEQKNARLEQRLNQIEDHLKNLHSPQRSTASHFFKTLKDAFFDFYRSIQRYTE